MFVFVCFAPQQRNVNKPEASRNAIEYERRARKAGVDCSAICNNDVNSEEWILMHAMLCTHYQQTTTMATTTRQSWELGEEYNEKLRVLEKMFELRYILRYKCLRSSIKAFNRIGYTMHDFQKRVAMSILMGHDVCLLAGTISGKSLAFEVPILLLDKKVSIIVTPLNALMTAQVECSL